MAVIKSGDSTDQLVIDPTSKAARVTLYDPDGSLQVPSVKASYMAFSPSFTPGATPQDVFTISGSASKLVRVLSFFLSSLQTTSGGIGSVVASSGSVATLSGAFINFTPDLGKPIILRSASDVLAWNFGGVALPAGLSVRAGVRWTEE